MSPEKKWRSDRAIFPCIVFMVSHYLQSKMQFYAQHTTIYTPCTWLAHSMAIFFFTWHFDKDEICTFHNIFLFMSVNIKTIFVWYKILPTYYHQHTLPCNIFSKHSLPYSNWYTSSNISQLSLCHRTMFLVFSCLLISWPIEGKTLIYTYYLHYIYSHSISMVLCIHWSQKKYLLYEWMNDARKASFMNWQ